METSGDYDQDVTDHVLWDETDVSLAEFEVVPIEASGPKCPMILHLHQEWQENKKKQEREVPPDINENPEVVRIREAEREITKELSKFENRMAYSSKLPINKKSVFEDEDVTMSKELPVLLGREYFKFQSNSDASSTKTSCTDLEDGDVVPPKPSKELYLNFSYNNFNYTFPFSN